MPIDAVAIPKMPTTIPSPKEKIQKSRTNKSVLFQALIWTQNKNKTKNDVALHEKKNWNKKQPNRVVMDHILQRSLSSLSGWITHILAAILLKFALE